MNSWEEHRERFMVKVHVDSTTGCHEWTGSKCSDGYGNFVIGKKTHGAHRVAFVLKTGMELTSDIWVLHTCDHPPCVNPEHLFTGSRQDNIDDMVDKGRQAKGESLAVLIRGENSGTAKLTEQQVLHIRARLEQGERAVKLAKEFSVSQVSIHRITKGTRWSHIDGPRESSDKRKGANSNLSKLTESQVLSIKQLLIENIPFRSVAEIFGVTRQTIVNIFKGTTWKHLEVSA